MILRLVDQARDYADVLTIAEAVATARDRLAAPARRTGNPDAVKAVLAPVWAWNDTLLPLLFTMARDGELEPEQAIETKEGRPELRKIAQFPAPDDPFAALAERLR